MKSQLALKVVWFLVLLPTALIATFWSLMGIGVVIAGLRGDQSISPVASMGVAFALGLGWFGIATLSRLYSHFLLSSDRPPRPYAAIIGLLGGVLPRNHGRL